MGRPNFKSPLSMKFTQWPGVCPSFSEAVLSIGLGYFWAFPLTLLLLFLHVPMPLFRLAQDQHLLSKLPHILSLAPILLTCLHSSCNVRWWWCRVAIRITQNNEAQENHSLRNDQKDDPKIRSIQHFGTECVYPPQTSYPTFSWTNIFAGLSLVPN